MGCVKLLHLGGSCLVLERAYETHSPFRGTPAALRLSPGGTGNQSKGGRNKTVLLKNMSVVIVITGLLKDLDL